MIVVLSEEKGLVEEQREDVGAFCLPQVCSIVVIWIDLGLPWYRVGAP